MEASAGDGSKRVGLLAPPDGFSLFEEGGNALPEVFRQADAGIFLEGKFELAV